MKNRKNQKIIFARESVLKMFHFVEMWIHLGLEKYSLSNVKNFDNFLSCIDGIFNENKN